MDLEIKLLFVALSEMVKAFANKASRYIIKKMDSLGNTISEKIPTKDWYSHDDEEVRIRKYILLSMGGLDNIVFAVPYSDGYMFIFFDFEKVKYYNFKNLGARVFISEKRGGIILKPKKNTSIDMNKYLSFLN